MTDRRRWVWPAVTLTLVAVAIFLQIRGFGGHNTDASATRPPGSSASADPSQSISSPTADSVSLTQIKAQLNHRVKVFCRLYYQRSPTLTSKQIMQSVQPLATSTFMQTTPFGYGSSAADQAMKREGASLSVSNIQQLNGEMDDSHTVAAGSVTMRITKKDNDGHVVSSFPFQQTMTWVRTNGTWYIDSLNA